MKCSDRMSLGFILGTNFQKMSRLRKCSQINGCSREVEGAGGRSPGPRVVGGSSSQVGSACRALSPPPSAAASGRPGGVRSPLGCTRTQRMQRMCRMREAGAWRRSGWGQDLREPQVQKLVRPWNWQDSSISGTQGQGGGSAGVPDRPRVCRHGSGVGRGRGVQRGVPGAVTEA